MKKRILLIFCLLFVAKRIFSISILNGKVSFDIPNNMELRGEIPSKYFSSGEIIMTQKGLQEGNINALDEYARIIINVKQADENSKYIYGNLNLFSPEIIDEMDNILRNIAKENISHLIKWNPIKIINLNYKTKAIITTFIRSSLQHMNSQVQVQSYTFLIDNFLIEIICSYRINDSNEYKSDLNKFIKSIKIIN